MVTTDLDSVNWRLIDADKIRIKIEALVIDHEERRKEPSQIALYLLTIGRQDILAQMFRGQYRDREHAFWSRDFSQDHNKQAALRNAQNCLHLNNCEYAVAFYLAAGYFQNAIETLLIVGLDNLAALVYRTHSGECNPYIGQGIQLGKMATNFDDQLENMRQTLGMCLSESHEIDDTMTGIQSYTAMFVN